ncbi:MAG: translation initiation factor eIF-1A [Nanobdellota archaeon]
MAKKKDKNYQPQEVTRVPLPKGNQVMGIVEQRVGGSRMYVKCFDGKTRLCRIPGRLKKNLWVRERNVVIIEPWEFGGDEKGDVICKYRRNQVEFLKKKGYLKSIDFSEEF